MMTIKRKRIYEIALIACCCVIIALTAYMGITAVQKSMKLKIGFEVKPTFECKIVYNGNTIFCNSTKDSNGTFVGNGFTLNGNTLSFNQSFEGIGNTFVLTIYNYSDVSIKISVSGTNVSGGPLTLAAYENSAPSGELTLVTTSASEAILTFEEYTPPPYTIKTYDGTNSAWNGYYCVEFGEYPVAVATPSSPTATGETYTYGNNTFTIYKDANGKYATINSGTDYYKFEPIRWIVIAASTDIAGQYGTGSNITKDVTGTKQLLLLSEFGLYREYFDKESSYTNQFGSSDCDVQVSLNDSFAKMAGLYDYFEDDETANYIAMVQPGTTYADSSDNEQFDSTSSYNMFLLGRTNGSDSNVDTYHWDEYMDSGSEQMQCVPTAFAKTTGVYYSSSYDACYWWLRSGDSDYSYLAYYVNSGGLVSFSDVYYYNLAVRPSFILNLA